MNAVGNLLVYSLAMIVLPVGGFFSSKAILFESKFKPQQICLAVLMIKPLIIRYLPSFFWYIASVYQKDLNSMCICHIGVLGYSDGSVGGAIIAVILIHLVIVMFVYKAWSEGQGTQPIKQD